MDITENRGAECCRPLLFGQIGKVRFLAAMTRFGYVPKVMAESNAEEVD